MNAVWAKGHWLWHTLHILRRPISYYAELAATYGDTFFVTAGNGEVLCTANPAVIEAAMTTPNTKLAAFHPEILQRTLGHGSVVTLDGDAHRRERKLLQPAFHGPRLRAFAEAIQSVAAERVSRWEPGTQRVAMDDMLVITTEIISRVVFGADDGARVDAYREALLRVASAFSPWFLFIPSLQRPLLGLGPWDRFTVGREELRELAHQDIARRRAAGTEGRSDVLSMMIEARYEDGEAMSDEAIFAELLTLLFAGHETTTIALSQAMSMLALHPEALAELRNELTPLDGRVDQVMSAPLLDATCREVLRLADIVPDFLRTAKADVDLAGWTVKAGQHFAVISSVLHRRPDLYPEPEAFRPRRFLDKHPSPFEMTPFGGGTRRCLGAALAMQEMKLTLDVIVRKGRWSVAGPEPIVRRNVTLAPAHGVRFSVLAA